MEHNDTTAWPFRNDDDCLLLRQRPGRPKLVTGGFKMSKTTVQEWRESTEDAIAALQEWANKLAEWERRGCDRGEFHAALWSLRSAGLEEWADGNKAGLDALAAVTTTGR
jgi:hypothetical protein